MLTRISNSIICLSFKEFKMSKNQCSNCPFESAVVYINGGYFCQDCLDLGNANA